MSEREFGVGDAIEVGKMDFTREGGVVEEWVPATVQYADDWQVVAVYADGRREAIRRARVRRPLPTAQDRRDER